MWPHGSIGVAFNGLHFQVVGLPSPRGLVPIIAKYMPCGVGPWKRPSGRLCRVNPEYGPKGVEAAAVKAGLGLRWDEAYGALVPYLDLAKALIIVDPWEAMAEVARSPRPPQALTALEAAFLVAPGCGGCVGVTGSLAMGMAVPEISDIDLVVEEGWEEEVYRRWRRIVKPLPAPASEGGVAIADTLEWRRGLLGGFHISWIAAPRRPASHCPPLRRYPNLDTPRAAWRGRLTVRPGQPAALLYPPCVEAEEGLWIISYEYNVARLLYEGGTLEVEGLKGESTVYLAARPNPGSIRRHQPPY